MKNIEIKEALLKNGIENEKKANSIVVWHEIFGFFLVVFVCNILDGIFNINFGILILLGSIGNALLWKKYVEKNLNDVEKLTKSCKRMKIGTALLIVILISVLAILVATGYLY